MLLLLLLFKVVVAATVVVARAETRPWIGAGVGAEAGVTAGACIKDRNLEHGTDHGLRADQKALFRGEDC